MKTLLAITTYLKNQALREIIRSLIEFDYHTGNTILICDDAAGGAKEVYEEYKDKCDLHLVYGKHRVGIAKNKNRGIKYFLENPGFSHIMMLDDDIEFIKAGGIQSLLESLEGSNLPHQTAYLGDYSHPKTGQGFFHEFKPIQEDEYTYWCKGCQGILIFLPRKTAEEVGYFSTDWKSHYGYEHAEYAARINTFYATEPQLFPIWKRSYKYFKTQLIPNNYEANHLPNAPIYDQKLARIRQGLGLVWKESGLDKKETVI
jgi:glycosyltransferase involved in cell wall biosynthesis